MQAFSIDNATAEDIPALVGLLAELFSIEKDFQADTQKQVRGLQLLLNHPDTAIIKVARNQEGLAIGMVSAQLVTSTAQGTPSAWVEDMVISQDYRACGIGKTLLQAALDWAKAKGASRAQLLVDIENQPALAYYSHLGWQNTQLQARKIML